MIVNKQKFFTSKIYILCRKTLHFIDFVILFLLLYGGFTHESSRQNHEKIVALAKAKPMIDYGLMTFDGYALRFTTKGNLVSNVILATIL